MHLYRLVVPVLVAFIALAGASNLAFASGQPSDDALAIGTGASQDAGSDGEVNDATSDENGGLDGDGASDVRPDRLGPKHRLAALCYRLLDSDQEAPALRARCARIFGDDVPDPATICRQLAERGADDEAVRRCVQRLSDGIDGADFCRRVAQSEGNDVAKQRCRDQLSDVADPAQICRRAIEADRVPATAPTRCRDHLGDDAAPNSEQIRARLLAQLQNADGATVKRLRTLLAQHGGDAGQLLRRRLGGNADSPFRVRPSEVAPVGVSSAP